MIREIDISLTPLAQQVVRLQRAAYAIESALIDYPQLPPLFESVADLQTCGERFLIHELDGQLAGVLSFETAPEHLLIARLAVDPARFGCGVGSALLGHMSSLRAGRPLLRVSTAEKNTPAVRLYEQQGFAIYERAMLPDGLALVRLEKRFQRRS